MMETQGNEYLEKSKIKRVNFEALGTKLKQDSKSEGRNVINSSMQMYLAKQRQTSKIRYVILYQY